MRKTVKAVSNKAEEELARSAPSPSSNPINEHKREPISVETIIVYADMVAKKPKKSIK